MRCEKVLLQEQQGMGDYIHLTSCNEKMSLIFSLFREREGFHINQIMSFSFQKMKNWLVLFSKLH